MTMESMIKKLIESRRLDEARVGAFYFLGDSIVSNDTNLKDGEEYGNFVNYSSHWDLWSAFCRYFPEYKSLDYDYFPRGRVVFDKNKWKYILYLDPKLKSPKYLNKILRRYGLSQGSFEFGNDEHYKSLQPEYDVDDEEIDGDFILGESLDHYIHRETY